MELFKNTKITKHFIERYAERILNRELNCKFSILKDEVLNDMIERMTAIEKKCFELLCLSGNVKLTLGNVSRIVLSNNTLITVY